MLSYAFATLRDRAAGFVGAFVALFCAAAMVTACLMLLDTGLRGTIETERYAATPIIVAGDQEVHERTVKEKKGDKPDKVKDKSKPIFERAWMPQDTARRIEQVEGVAKVVPEVSFPAHLIGTDGEALGGPDGSASWGHDWGSAPLTPFALSEGDEPQGASEVVLDQGLAESAQLGVGDSVSVQSTGESGEYRVVGIARAEVPLTQQAALFFSKEQSRHLSDRDGEVMSIGVFPSPGVTPAQLRERIDAVLDDQDAVVHVGAERGSVEFLDAAGARVQLVSVGGAMAGTAILVAILVVVGTFALSIQQRHRELALLRAVAATPRQVHRIIGAEALIVAAVASAMGAGAGVPLAYGLHFLFVDRGAIPASLALSVSAWPPLAAAAASTISAMVAARISSHRTARIRPAEGLFEAEVERRSLGSVKMATGVAVLCGAAALLVLLSRLRIEQASTPVTFLTVIALATALSLLGPLIVRVVMTFAGPLLGRSGAAGQLAAANIRAQSARAAAVISPLTLLVAMAATVAFSQTTMNEAAGREVEDGTDANLVVVADGPGVPSAAAEDIRSTEGVTDVAEVVTSTVRAGLTRLDIHGISAESVASTVDLDVAHGSVEGFDDDSIALSEVAASRVDAAVGDELEVAMGDGTERTVTVDAVYARGLGFADAVMAHEVVVQHMDDPRSEYVWVTGPPSLDPAQVRKVISAHPGLRAIDRHGWGTVRADAHQADAEVNYIALGLVVVFTAISVVNTTTMAILARGREFALLRLNGGMRRQVRRMVLCETFLTAAIGVLLGTGVAIAVLSAFSVGMTGRAAPGISTGTYGLIVGAAALLVTIATILPYRVVTRTDPGQKMGER